MRGIYISATLLVIVLLVALFYMLAIFNVSNNFASIAIAIEQDIALDSMSDAGDKIEEIDQMWRRNGKWIAIFVNHSEMEEIQYIIERMKTYIESDDKSSLKAELAEFKERIKHLPLMEQPTVENVL